MITLNRSQLVGAEFVDEETVRFHGVQTDHIYDMEIQLDVCIPEGEIVAIEGWMKRYTNPICPRAVDVLQKAVGLSLREENWESRVMREIGRNGCQHFAEILIECGRSLDLARISRDLFEALKSDPALDQEQYINRWIKEHPEVKDACLARD
jgi:hypothetical protein